MEVYRLVKSEFLHQFNGKGAALFGGRWNSIGMELIYTAGNRSLAMMEVLVHLHMSDLPKDLYMLRIHIPDHLAIAELQSDTLPPGWNRYPALTTTAALGDSFILEKKHAVLKVPSVVTQGDFNFLINPAHPDFPQIRVVDTEPFPFDQRLLRTGRLN